MRMGVRRCTRLTMGFSKNWRIMHIWLRSMTVKVCLIGSANHESSLELVGLRLQPTQAINPVPALGKGECGGGGRRAFTDSQNAADDWDERSSCFESPFGGALCLVCIIFFDVVMLIAARLVRSIFDVSDRFHTSRRIHERRWQKKTNGHSR
jgi:hypothetical protein